MTEELPGFFGSLQGEDEIIKNLFPPDYVGVAVEVGAGDGLALSNTLKLERAGWTVLCIEPDPMLVPALVAARLRVLSEACSDHDGEADFYQYDLPSSIYHNGVLGTLGPVTPWFEAILLPNLESVPVVSRIKCRTLNAMLDEANLGPIDFVSIDVDGQEMKVLSGWDIQRWRPRFVMIEDIYRPPASPIRRWFYKMGYSFYGPLGPSGIDDLYARS